MVYNNISKKDLGILIESPGLYQDMTALENLNYFCKLFKIDCKDNMDILTKVGLSKAVNKKVKQFSLGMRQRLGIAIAIFIPLTIQTLLSLVRIKVNLDFMKINYYFQLLTGEFNTAYIFKAVIVISAYLILAVFMNKKILNSSDVR